MRVDVENVVEVDEGGRKKKLGVEVEAIICTLPNLRLLFSVVAEIEAHVQNKGRRNIVRNE